MLAGCGGGSSNTMPDAETEPVNDFETPAIAIY